MISPAYADRSEWDFGQYLDFLRFLGLFWVRGRVFRYDILMLDTSSTRRIDPRHPDSPNTSYLETLVTCIFRFSAPLPRGGRRRRRRRRRKNFSTTTSPSPIMHGDPISRSASPSLRPKCSTAEFSRHCKGTNLMAVSDSVSIKLCIRMALHNHDSQSLPLLIQTAVPDPADAVV